VSPDRPSSGNERKRGSTKAKNCRRSTEQELRQIGLKWNKLEEGTLWQCSTLHRGAKGTESEGREGRVEGATKHSIKSFPLSQPHPSQSLGVCATSFPKSYL